LYRRRLQLQAEAVLPGMAVDTALREVEFRWYRRPPRWGMDLVVPEPADRAGGLLWETGERAWYRPRLELPGEQALRAEVGVAGLREKDR